MNLYNNVKYSRGAPDEIEIVEKFSRHFDEQTQTAILMRNTNTKVETYTRKSTPYFIPTTR